MHNRKKLYNARLVYNRTNRVITCYNGEGTIIELMPTDNPLPDYEFGIIYVVDKTEYEQILLSGRTTEDLAHVVEERRENQVGRGNVKVVYLEMYDKEEDGHSMCIVPCSVASYVLNDPNGEIHRVLDV